MNQETNRDFSRQLEAKWQVAERPFTSRTPIFGPLIVRLRQMCNDIATTWYVRAIVQQQNEYNHSLLEAIRRLETVDDTLDGRLTTADHDQAELARQLAELTSAVNQINQRLPALEVKLTLSEPWHCGLQRYAAAPSGCLRRPDSFHRPSQRSHF